MDTVPARIFIIDDVVDNLEILGDLLTFHGYQVETAQGGEQAFKRLQVFRPDLILLDVVMPGMDGFEVCEKLKAEESTSDIPIIFVSSMTDLGSKVKGFEVGAVDYVNKPFQKAEILMRVNTHLTIKRLYRHLEEQNLRLEHLANTDPMTELYNRRYFFRVAEGEFAKAIEAGFPTSVTLIDLDFFKRVNDTYGHLVGDRILIHVAHQIRACCRKQDVLARYGGEEFVLLHPNTGQKDAYELAETIRKTVQETPYDHDTESITVTLSAGVVEMQECEDCSRLDDLLSRADRALYRAKQTGRNRVVPYRN